MIPRKRLAKRPLIVVLLTLGTALLAAGCGVRGEAIGLEIGSRTSFDKDWQRYARVRASKAFAYAGDPVGLSVTGMAYGMPSRLEAETRALDYCEEQRVARGLSAPCVIFAVDDQIVHVAAEAPPPSPSRSGS